MNRRLRNCLGVACSTATLMATTTLPASADTTNVTFALTGGALAVSTQASAPWGDKGGSGTTTVSGSLGTTVLTDNRGGTAGWSVGAATTAFANGTTNAASVSYNSGVPTTTGIVVATSTGPTTLSATPTQVVAGTVVVGNNTATWMPTLTVTLPGSSTVGSYTGTITTSVL
jgi:hypothetical protein